MKTKAIIYEPWAHNMAHYEFLKAFVKTILCIYKDVTFIGEKELVSHLKTELVLQNCQFKIFKITTYNTTRGKLLSIPNEVKNLLRIKILANDSDVYFSFGAPHSMLIAEKVLKKDSVFYVQHMALQAIHENLGATKLNHYVLPAIKKLPENHKLIVLGDSIKENLLKDVPKLSHDKVIAIEHPFLFQNKTVLNENKGNVILRIGTVGLGTVGKGYDKLNEIGHFIKNNNLSDKMNLFHVGNLLGVTVDSEYVTLPFNSSNMIPSSDFNSEIAKLDWLLFLYPADSYKLVASGAVFDAFKFGKPILAIKNDYFMHLAGLGDTFGFLVNNIEELKKQLECLPNINSDEYKKMSDNSRKMLSNFLPEVVAEQLRSQL